MPKWKNAKNADDVDCLAAASVGAVVFGIKRSCYSQRTFENAIVKYSIIRITQNETPPQLKHVRRFTALVRQTAWARPPATLELRRLRVTTMCSDRQGPSHGVGAEIKLRTRYRYALYCREKNINS